jgi:hypothetical protein
MKKLATAAVLILMTGTVMAQVFTETFDDPLGGWRDRWLAQNTDMGNYYVCTGNPDEDYRGNNPCGIWICDSDGNYQSSIVEFNPTFGATVTYFEIGIQAFVDATYTVYDMSGGVVYSAVLTVNYGSPYGCYCTQYGCDTPRGIGRFEIISTYGSQIEGNTAVDNVTAISSTPSPAESTTWGSVKSLFR